MGRPERGVIAARLSSRTNDDLSSLGVPPLESKVRFLPFPDLAGEENKGDEKDRRERGKGGWFGEGQI